jgi:hypothetical protein
MLITNQIEMEEISSSFFQRLRGEIETVPVISEESFLKEKSKTTKCASFIGNRLCVSFHPKQTIFQFAEEKQEEGIRRFRIKAELKREKQNQTTPLLSEIRLFMK